MNMGSRAAETTTSVVFTVLRLIGLIHRSIPNGSTGNSPGRLTAGLQPECALRRDLLGGFLGPNRPGTTSNCNSRVAAVLTL